MKNFDQMNWWEKTKKIYNYIFHENTILSWIASIIVAYVVVKFLFYPGLGLILGVDLPLVAVISPSMEHDRMGIDGWWDENGVWYETRGISYDQFKEFKMKNGFYIGDVIVLRNKNEIEVGDVVVYQNEFSNMISNYPIIHRVTFINEDDNSFEVKGDNNPLPDQMLIKENEVMGVALYRIPYIGMLKIWFSKLIGG